MVGDVRGDGRPDGHRLCGVLSGLRPLRAERLADLGGEPGHRAGPLRHPHRRRRRGARRRPHRPGILPRHAARRHPPQGRDRHLRPRRRLRRLHGLQRLAPRQFRRRLLHPQPARLRSRPLHPARALRRPDRAFRHRTRRRHHPRRGGRAVMELTILAVTFFGFLVLGIPVAFAIGLSALCTILYEGLPVAVIFQQMM
ncbi:protein of unknown function, partial (plasmid) [Azospirillum baldaniorum]